MSYRIIFTPEAENQLADIYNFIADDSPLAAAAFTNAIVDFISGFEIFPHRGDARNDIRRGLRVTNYRKSTVIAFSVDDASLEVSIAGIFYGGQDYENVLRV